MCVCVCVCVCACLRLSVCLTDCLVCLRRSLPESPFLAIYHRAVAAQASGAGMEVLIAERGSSAREFCPQVGSPDKASKALEAAASVGSAGEGDECKSTARDSA